MQLQWNIPTLSPYQSRYCILIKLAAVRYLRWGYKSVPETRMCGNDNKINNEIVLPLLQQ